MNNTPETGIGQMYDRRLREGSFGPPTYTSAELLGKIYDATGLSESQSSVRVLDSMSGPGLVGTQLQKKDDRHDYYYLDLLPQSLLAITSKNAGRVAGNALALPFIESSFQIGVARYAIKDVPEGRQQEIFQEMGRVVMPGGNFVVADMYVPHLEDPVQQGQLDEFINFQHAMKQERGGRSRSKEGSCHIPTLKGWLDLYTQAGFRARVMDFHISHVNTRKDWSNQVKNGADIAELNHILLTAPQIVREVLNIKQVEDSVELDFPVIILSGTK